VVIRAVLVTAAFDRAGYRNFAIRLVLSEAASAVPANLAEPLDTFVRKV
jgi:hypothetical protein